MGDATAVGLAEVVKHEFESIRSRWRRLQAGPVQYRHAVNLGHKEAPGAPELRRRLGTDHHRRLREAPGHLFMPVVFHIDLESHHAQPGKHRNKPPWCPLAGYHADAHGNTRRPQATDDGGDKIPQHKSSSGWPGNLT